MALLVDTSRPMCQLEDALRGIVGDLSKLIERRYDNDKHYIGLGNLFMMTSALLLLLNNKEREDTREVIKFEDETRGLLRTILFVGFDYDKLERPALRDDEDYPDKLKLSEQASILVNSDLYKKHIYPYTNIEISYAYDILTEMDDENEDTWSDGQIADLVHMMKKHIEWYESIGCNHAAHWVMILLSMFAGTMNHPESVFSFNFLEHRDNCTMRNLYHWVQIEQGCIGSCLTYFKIDDLKYFVEHVRNTPEQCDSEVKAFIGQYVF